MTSMLAFAYVMASSAVETSTLLQPASTEHIRASQWTAHAFGLAPTRDEPMPRVEVLANNDPVQVDRRNEGGLNIAGNLFAKGLYVHAVSDLKVVVGRPVSRLVAWVGVHTNAQTSGGRGSVEFVVEAGGKVVYRSGVMREGMPAVYCDVELAGAREFSLKVTDGGDGIACDQGVWADPVAILENGERLPLNLVPIDPVPPAGDKELPFSFMYNGRSSRDFLESWSRVAGEPQQLPNGVIYQELAWAAPDSGLRVRCEITRYAYFPTVEWVLWFENDGTGDTPLLEAIHALDMSLPTTPGAVAPTLHHNRGTLIAANDFEPLTTALGAGSQARFAPPQGRPTAAEWPYYNLAIPDRGGLIVSVGWPGTWFAQFTHTPENAIQLLAGQETTRFVIRPGEKIRSPRMTLQFWQGGDWWRAQNLWRQWMVAHIVPRTDTGLPTPLHAACSSHQYAEMIHANEDNQKMFINRYFDRGMPLDYWWMDAGWYPCDDSWPKTGTWEVDASRFPNGLRAVADHAMAKGAGTIVWFEPERVAPGTWLDVERPEWLLKTTPEAFGLLDLGNPGAWAWLVEHIDNLIVSEGITLYRQDYNIDPLPYWRQHDAENRQGITENLYVQGYLAYWDALLERHPGMLIDTCASGGHRLDLETLRRSIPLLRSDYILEPMGQQGHTYGLAAWVPVFGTGVNRTDPYGFRSQMGPTINTCYDMRPDDADFSQAATLIRQWRELTRFYAGDFYRLSPYAVDGSGIMAWQFDLPREGEGMVQAFRQESCIYRALDLRLQNLDPNAHYRCRDLDSGQESTHEGRSLMRAGLPLELPGTDTARIITYSRL